MSSVAGGADCSSMGGSISPSDIRVDIDAVAVGESYASCEGSAGQEKVIGGSVPTILFADDFTTAPPATDGSGASGTGQWTSSWSGSEVTNVLSAESIESGTARLSNAWYEGSYALVGEREWTDYTLRVTLRGNDATADATSGYVGVAFRFNPYDGSDDADDDHYLFTMASGGNFRALMRLKGGSATELYR